MSRTEKENLESLNMIYKHNEEDLDSTKEFLNKWNENESKEKLKKLTSLSLPANHDTCVIVKSFYSTFNQEIIYVFYFSIFHQFIILIFIFFLLIAPVMLVYHFYKNI